MSKYVGMELDCYNSKMVLFSDYKHLWESIEGYWREGEGTQI